MTKGNNMTILETQAQVLRLKEAAAYCGFSTTTLWRLEKSDPLFPKKIRFSAHVCGFRKADLDRYLLEKVGG